MLRDLAGRRHPPDLVGGVASVPAVARMPTALTAESVTA